jgi:hypothetical protein
MFRIFPPLLLVAILFLSLFGCATFSPYMNKSYRLGDTISARMGSPMILYSTGTALHTAGGGIMKRGVGMELVYTGLTDNILHIVYREYAESDDGSFAKSPFTLSLVYDVRTDSTIVFRDYLIRILESNSRFVRFIVLEEPSTLLADQPGAGISAVEVKPGSNPKLKLKDSNSVLEIRIVSEELSTIRYYLIGEKKEGRAHKDEIEFIVMPDGKIRKF